MTNVTLALEVRRVIAELTANPIVKETRGKICLVPKHLLERLVMYSGAAASHVLTELRGENDHVGTDIHYHSTAPDLEDNKQA